MARPIKFKRVFQHSETGMITMTVWGNVDHKDEICDDFSFFKSPSVITGWHPIADVQFIGLKDKNGKEIYQGDIVRSWDLKGMVYYDDGSFWWGRTPDDEESLQLCQRYWTDNIEVIGNIYENPELK